MNDLNEEISKKLYDIGNREEKQKVKTLTKGCEGEEYTHCEECKENCHDPFDCIHLLTSRCTIYPVFGSECEKCGHLKERHSRDKYRYKYEYINVKDIDSDKIEKTTMEKIRRENEIKRDMQEENIKKTNIERIVTSLKNNIDELTQKKKLNIEEKKEIENKIKDTNNKIIIIIVRLQESSQRLDDLAMNNNYIKKDNEYIDSLIDKYTEVYGNDNEKIKELEEMKKYNERFQKTVKIDKEELFKLNDSQIADMLKKMDF